jgi:hypothetical protein
VPFKKKERKNDDGDLDSQVAIDDAASRGSMIGSSGANYSGGSHDGQDASESLRGSSVATVQGTRPSEEGESRSFVGEKVATPFKGRLGDILIEGNLIDDEQLEQALARAAGVGRQAR